MDDDNDDADDASFGSVDELDGAHLGIDILTYFSSRFELLR